MKQELFDLLLFDLGGVLVENVGPKRLSKWLPAIRSHSTILVLFRMQKIYEFIHEFTICKKGCNYYCHYEITITDLEIEYIKRKIKIKKLRLSPFSQACPFLKYGSCLIYEVRPFICRRHLFIVDTAKWCKIDVCHDFEFPLINLSEIDKCYEYLVGLKGMNSLKDIRQAFK